MTAANEFLSLLFGHESLSGLYLTIWDKQTKRTSAFQLPALESAAVNAVARAEDADVYFGVCPYTKVEPGSRGVGDDAGAVVGFWLDVDVRSEAHKAEALPENDVQAFDLIYEMPHKPSLIVHSGYGLQAWWLLDRPRLLKTEAERKDAARATGAWVDLANAKAKAHGWKLDPVGDLARVLRVPGTWNRKRSEGAMPVSCKMKAAHK